MKTVFLVKKDPDAPNDKENWLIMEWKKFMEFRHSPEGGRRIAAFSQLDSCSLGDVKIVAECGEEMAKIWRKEKDRNDYLRERNRALGIVTISCDAKNGFAPDEADLLGDPGYDMEDEIIRKLYAEKIWRTLEELDPDELDLIEKLYLNDVVMMEWEYAGSKGISQQAVSKRKNRVLMKIKKRLNEMKDGI